jgi:hypothetical protein
MQHSVLLRQSASLIVPSRSFSAAATWADKYRQASGFRRYGEQ